MRMRAGIQGLLLTLASFVGLLALYQGLIWGGVLPASGGMTQWEENVIRSERYVYDGVTGAPVVLTGSSLMANVMGHSDWDTAVDLGMNGGTSQSGLEILRHSAHTPGVVVVELNDTISRPLDGKLLEGIFGPGIYQLRNAFSMFRTEYRPLSVLVRILATYDNDPNAAPADDTRPRLTARDQQRRERAVARAYPTMMQPLSAAEETEIRRSAVAIQQQITDLEAQGWRVLLTDLPRDSKLATTTREQQVRALLQELFPSDRYRWLPEPPARDWATRDGSHLVRADARDVAAFLREQIAVTMASAE
ncbi:MAG: hypothetical protein HC822_19990 [Oscillochloris sp.]|nr:hypothetical protein [Oscillochloris sp.]